MYIFLKRLSFLFVVICCMSCCASVKEQKHATIDTVQAQILQDVQILSSDAFEGRGTGTSGAEKARSFIVERFKYLTITPYPDYPEYIQSFTFDTKKGSQVGKNVVGYIPGKLRETIVISAHYDHLGIKNGHIYPGADDNASGVAALMHIADYFSKNKPNFTLIFAAFDAEEVGLKGAEAFVAHSPVPLNQIKLNINMDMLAHNDQCELYACGTSYYPQFKKYIQSGNPDLTIKLGHDNPNSKRDDWTDQSDQAAFHVKGIPFIYFGVEDHKDYHKPSDTFENINAKFYVDAANEILAIVTRIDNQFSSQIQMNKNKVM